MGILKDLLPIAGAAAGYFLGGPAGSAAINAALGSGIGTLAAGGDAEDAIRNAILAGGAGAGLGALGVGTGAAGAAAQSAGAKAATEAAASKALEKAATDTAVKAAAGEAAKGGIFGTGITAGDVAVGSSLLGLISGGEDEMVTGQPGGEADPSYKGQPYKGLFVDPQTGIAYDTVEELEEAVKDRQNLAEGGIVTLNAGGFIEGPGTGTSDSIKAGIYQNGKKVSEARLSDEEFVMTKKAVTGAGNGDPKKGAKVMYAMMDKFERMA